MAKPEAAAGEAFEFTPADFAFVQQFLRAHAGIALGAQKRSMAYGRLSRRLRALGLTRFQDYRARLEAGDEAEIAACVNALTTNLTKFFREEHHFHHLRDRMLAGRAGAGRKRLRLWSAGCSTGEEPYSMAIVLREWLRRNPGWDAKILATDLDTGALEKAQAGLYAEDGAAPALAWSRAAFRAEGGRLRVAPDIRELITFKPLNLQHPWPMAGPFDAIFCRNVMIYFDRETQKSLVERFHALLAPHGVLYIGHSESLHYVSGLFVPAGRTIYARA